MPELIRRVVIQAAVEGIVDEAVAKKIIAEAGGIPGAIYGKNGKVDLHRRIQGYNNAARHGPWLVMVDLDRDAECAPLLREKWVPQSAPHLCFRVAVREVEAWLMADAESLASFLSVFAKHVPANPELLSEPKIEMVNLARRSRRRDIRQDMAPRENSGRKEGPAYASRLIEFVHKDWRPQVAAMHSQSLRRALACLESLVKTVSR